MTVQAKRDQEVRVVVVDDNPDFAQIISELLVMAGYRVETVWDAHEAFDLIDRFSPHCVVLDCVMPGVDGHEFASTLRTRYGGKLMLVAVSGLDVNSSRVSTTLEFVDHYLHKPVEYDRLTQILPEVSVARFNAW